MPWSCAHTQGSAYEISARARRRVIIFLATSLSLVVLGDFGTRGQVCVYEHTTTDIFKGKEAWPGM